MTREGQHAFVALYGLLGATGHELTGVFRLAAMTVARDRHDEQTQGSYLFRGTRLHVSSSDNPLFEAG
ncbi:hypothetical protein [Sorangium sp. So ce1151]|uniref:hypothetical protein n=1 Tax=Sorangium sp. So ce1151 TaxID=3133332 RepID=UPI003F5EE6E3